MKRFYLLIALLLALPFAESCAQPKEIRTVAILGDSYSTFDGYIPEGNAWSRPGGISSARKEDTSFL